jgi:hypothetical protein
MWLVGVIVIAFGASIFAGMGAGLVVVTRRWAAGVRPRAFIRNRADVFDAISVFGSAFAVVIAAAAVVGADALQLTLAISCIAAAVLFGAAAWLLSVEPDDDGSLDEWPEPNWWPEFERDLDEWRRAQRTPTLSRR